MSHQIEELIVRVRDLNPELTAADSARIVRWMNDERYFLQNETATTIKGELGLTTFLRDTVADADLYALPCDFRSLAGADALWLKKDNAATAFIPLVKVSEKDIIALDEQGATNPETDRFVYALRDNGIRIRPRPTEVVTDGMKIVYYRSYADWELEDQIEDIWDRWREVLVTGAALRSGIRYEDARTELTQHYDQRLLPQFRRDFSERDLTAQDWKSPRGARSRRAREATFGVARRSSRIRQNN